MSIIGALSGIPVAVFNVPHDGIVISRYPGFPDAIIGVPSGAIIGRPSGAIIGIPSGTIIGRPPGAIISTPSGAIIGIPHRTIMTQPSSTQQSSTQQRAYGNDSSTWVDLPQGFRRS